MRHHCGWTSASVQKQTPVWCGNLALVARERVLLIQTELRSCYSCARQLPSAVWRRSHCPAGCSLVRPQQKEGAQSPSMTHKVMPPCRPSIKPPNFRTATPNCHISSRRRHRGVCMRPCLYLQKEHCRKILARQTAPIRRR